MPTNPCIPSILPVITGARCVRTTRPRRGGPGHLFATRPTTIVISVVVSRCPRTISSECFSASTTATTTGRAASSGQRRRRVQGGSGAASLYARRRLRSYCPSTVPDATPPSQPGASIRRPLCFGARHGVVSRVAGWCGVVFGRGQPTHLVSSHQCPARHQPAGRGQSHSAVVVQTTGITGMHLSH